MDAAQKLISKEIGTDESYQSVLNSEKKTIDPFHPVSQQHVQLLHDRANHWFLSFCSNGRVQVCDSLRSSLTRSSRKSIRSFYKHYVADGGEQFFFYPYKNNQMVTIVDLLRSPTPQKFLMDTLLQKQYLM